MSKNKGEKTVEPKGIYVDKVHGGRQPMETAPTPPSRRIPIEEGREPARTIPTPPPPPKPVQKTPGPPPAPAQKTP